MTRFTTPQAAGSQRGRCVVPVAVVVAGELFVEGVGGAEPVEGVLGGDVLELRVEVEVVVGVEGVAGEVVEGVGASFAQAALVGGVGGVGIVGPGIQGSSDVRERDRGQVGVHFAAAEEPGRQREGVAGKAADVALLVDEADPVAYGGGPVVVLDPPGVQAEQRRE